LYIFLVILLGFLLRLTNLIKPEGLWNDEYVSWFIASTPFNQGFWHEIFKQCHMPLYYLYLKPFSFFGDTILRLTSVVPSIIAIFVMYYAGKEYSKKTGLISATITAILPFLVYYSQEVRFYSLAFLFSALMLLFAIRIVKNPDKKNIIFYSLSTIILIFTHVLGIIFAFLLTAYLIIKKKWISKKIIFSTSIVLVLVFLIGLNILKQLPSSQWWGTFSYTNILFLFSDFFSPILTNHVNAPSIFYYNSNPVFIALITIPTLVGLLGLILGFKKTKDFIIISFILILIMALLAITGKIVFITKYSIEILPIFILGFSCGLSEEKIIHKFLLCLFVFINLFSVFLPLYPAKMPRNEGHKLPTIILNGQKPDNIIFTYYAPDRFFRYLKTDSKMNHISKINRSDYMENPSAIFNGIKSGESVSIVFLNSVSFIPQNMIEKAKEQKLPEMFITFSSIRHNLTKYATANLKEINLSKIGSWTILNGIKK
jgi:uncharacterized membrane protein